MPFSRLILALAAIAVAAVLLPAATAGTAALHAASANSVTFQDSSEGVPDAPDITTVVVSNNDAGLITFQLNIPNRPSLTPDMLLLMFLETDGNAATGDPESLGADYAIQLFEGTSTLFKWDGTDFTTRTGDPPQLSLIFSYANGATIRISASELGNTKKVSFAVIVVSGLVTDPATGNIDNTKAKRDVAPDAGRGFYPFDVKIAPLTLVVKKLTLVPTKPAAGKMFTTFLQVARSDTGVLLASGQVTCTATVAGQRLTVRRRAVVNRQVLCAWVIPSTAKGKTMTVTISIVFEGKKASRTFSAKIV